jgi:hypothetical protein
MSVTTLALALALELAILTKDILIAFEVWGCVILIFWEKKLCKF